MAVAGSADFLIYTTRKWISELPIRPAPRVSDPLLQYLLYLHIDPDNVERRHVLDLELKATLKFLCAGFLSELIHYQYDNNKINNQEFRLVASA